MPTTIRIVLNRHGVRELLRDGAIANDVADRARQIAAVAGEGHEVVMGTGTNRAYARVLTQTFEAYFAEQTDRTLTRAIDAGR